MSGFSAQGRQGKSFFISRIFCRVCPHRSGNIPLAFVMKRVLYQRGDNAREQTAQLTVAITHDFWIWVLT
jgi:hypothetical protein